MSKPRPNPRCPKCRSRSVFLEEFSSVGMLFHVCEDGTIRRVWGGGTEAEFMYVEAQCCACEHRWRLKGVVQIGTLAGHKLDETLDARGERKTCDCPEAL